MEVRIVGSPEWLAWRDHPQTQLFLEWLSQTVKAHQESWARREFESADPHAWLTTNAAALARVAAYVELEDMIRNPEPIDEKRSGIGFDGPEGAGALA